jgi:hypothetical protein
MEAPAHGGDYVDLTAVQGELEVGPPSPLITSPTTGQAELAVVLAANPAVTAALSRDPSLGLAVAACLAAAKAAGTVWGYSCTLRCYNAFCTLAGLEPLSFSEDVLVQFVLHLDQREAGHQLLASVKPALVCLSSTMDVSLGSHLRWTCCSWALSGEPAPRQALFRRPPPCHQRILWRSCHGYSRHTTGSAWPKQRTCTRLFP